MTEQKQVCDDRVDQHLLRDVLQRDLVVSHLVNGTGLADGSLDTNTVDRILYDVVVECDSIDDIRSAATNRTNGETVTAGAEAVLEGDILRGLSVERVGCRLACSDSQFQSLQQRSRPDYRPSHYLLCVSCMQNWSS